MEPTSDRTDVGRDSSNPNDGPDDSIHRSSEGLKVALIGCGRMGSAIASGLLERDESARVWTFEPLDAARERLSERARRLGADERLSHCGSIAAASEAVDAVVLAVKPGLIRHVAGRVPDTRDQLLISVAAGVTAASVREVTPHRVVRVMPNTPALVGEGVTAILHDEHARSADVELTRRIFGALGLTETVHSESLMHAVIGVSGSGPAYAAMVVDALADGGVAEGLPRATALRLARQMVRGTMALLEEQHPADLKDGVCSPGGTTIAAVAELEAQGLRSALIQAVRVAAAKSRDMEG